MKDNVTFTNGTSLITKVLWIVSLVVVIAIAAVAYSQSQKAIRTMAVSNCMQAGRLERTTDKGEKVVIPEDYWYDKCMTESGNK